MAITLTIDGKTVRVDEGATVLQAAQKAGVYIPTLCADEDLLPFGACRLCLVEVQGDRRPMLPSCTTPATDGMVVRTSSAIIDKTRRNVVELLLSDHPEDCLTCPQNNRCDLQRVAAYVGVRTNRFRGEKHAYPIDDSNPFYHRDLDRCILCGKCVRTCDEIQQLGAIQFAYRGFRTKIATVLDRPVATSTCESCGQCVEKCPVGALYPAAWLRYGLPTVETKTTCPYCGVGCGLILQTRGNTVVGVRGDPENPVSHGRTCVKGRFGYEFINHADRLKKPLIKKDGAFVEVSWDEALDLVAERLAAVVRESGPDAVALLTSAKCTNEENYLLQKFARGVLGTHNVDHCARLCHSSTVTGLATAFGSGAMTNSIEDMREAKAFLIIGSNTTEQHPIIGLNIRKAVREGARLIVVDPRRTDLAKRADLHLAIEPGGNIALLNGLAHIILKEGWEDKEFIASRTEGFDEWRAVVEKYTPERVSEITGVPVEKLYEAAHLYATAKPATLVYAMGVTQHTSGHQGVQACANLQMLTGNMGIRGGGVNPLRGQNNVQGACDVGCLPDFFPGYQRVADEKAREKFAQAWGARFGDKPGLTIVEMLNAAEHGRVKALYVTGENPVMSDPDSQHVIHALESLDFLVVQDIFLSDTARLADVVLPAASFAEKSGTFTNTERRVQLIRPAIDPPGEARPDWEIVVDLARRTLKALGRTPDGPYAGWDYASPTQIMDEIAALAPIYGGIRHSRLENGGLQWPCPSTDHPGTPILHVGKFSRGLGKFNPVDYVPPAETPNGGYPLILTTGRRLEHYHTGTMTRRVAGLNKLAPEERVEINAQDAARLGIADGDWVIVESRRGRVKVRAAVGPRCRPGVVFMTFHFAEALGNVLTHAALDPVSKIPEFKVAAVRVQKA